MSESLADATTSSNAATSILLDGELPRLGGSAPATPAPTDPTPTPGAGAPFAAPATFPTSSPTAAPAVPAPASSQGPTGSSPMPSANGSAPIVGSPDLPTLPSLPTLASPATPAARPTTPSSVPQPVAVAPDLPTLPSVTPTVHPATAAPDDNLGNDESTPAPKATSEHPMAHLMPQKNVPSEASRRAAEIRAAKKAKARKIKFGVAIGALVFAVAVGPPLGKWFVNALNESGSTSTEVEE